MKRIEIKTPRRNQLNLNVPAELAITDAMYKVEELGCSPNLTKVITLLSEAKDILSDYIDNTKVEKVFTKMPFVIIDDITYWFDKEYEWEAEKIYGKYAIDYFENIDKGNLIIFDYKDRGYDLFKYHYHTLRGSHQCCIGKPYLIVAQSKPFLDNIPVLLA